MWPVSTGPSLHPARTSLPRLPGPALPEARLWPSSSLPGGPFSSPRSAGLPDPLFPRWGRAGASQRWPPGSHTLSLAVTGTTEKIFEEKRELYDVYVDNQNVKTHHGHLQPLLRINSADREKYRRLNEQR